MQKTTPLEKRIKRNIIAQPQTFFAATAPGFNKFCYNELQSLSLLLEKNSKGMIKTAMEINQPVSGGIEFSGYLHDFYYACMHLRTANRVLMRINSFKASNLRTLVKKIFNIPWELYIYENCVPSIHVTTKHSRIYHTKAISDLFIENIKNRFKKYPGKIFLNNSLHTSPDKLPDTLYNNLPDDTVINKKPDNTTSFQDFHTKNFLSTEIFIRTQDDKFTVSIDGCGELLYKRGIKKSSGKAPIRETTAAAALMFAKYNPQKPLIDPMCGAGTFSIEAAMMAKKIPPGWYREFAFMQWPCFKETRLLHIRREAEKEFEIINSPRIFASDLNENICINIKNTISDFTDIINISQRDFFDLSSKNIYNKIIPSNETGLIVINPPYGIRMGTKKECRTLFPAICNKLVKDFQGWNALLIVPEKYLLETIPFKTRTLSFIHGGLNLTLATGKIKS